MFDGHNLFDRTTSTYGNEWRVDETMQGPREPAIVVGIDAPQNRYDRYAMYTVSDWGVPRASSGRLLKRIRGYGDETAAFHRTSEAVRRSHLPGCERSGAGRRGRLVDGRVHVLVVGTRYQDRAF